MSIENNLERIATALEALVKLKTSNAEVKSEPPTEVKSVVETQMQKTAESPKTPPPPPVPTQTESVTTTSGSTPPVPSSSLVVKDATHCNELLVAEYERLGGTQDVYQKILAKMNELYGVRSVTELSSEQYAPFIEAVRALG